MDDATWTAVLLTARLAGLSTLLLLLVGTPLAWWLARTRSPAKPVLAALVTMPLVLPPSVLCRIIPNSPASVTLVLGS